MPNSESKLILEKQKFKSANAKLLATKEEQLIEQAKRETEINKIDHAVYPLAPLKSFDASGEFFSSVLAGPTCDSIDVISVNIELPEVKIGDILISKQMGAYTMASATEFNYYLSLKS